MKFVKVEQISHAIIKLSRKKLSEGKVQIDLLIMQYVLNFNKLQRVTNSYFCSNLC